ncbi:hypothetical protein MDA_GLEAN10020168 [Myotis davidii]|uniref:Uncharacterized protein n=1 Tax=Myotis davidii TaxID=225400 RepID=L5LJB6_MYODS|nr:hypothetical protein MDA_GLEAN10020168 [Myotis davidii]
MCFPSAPSEERGGEVLSPSPSPRLQNWAPPEAWPGQGKWHPEIKKAEGKEKKKAEGKEKTTENKKNESRSKVHGGHHLPTSAVEGSQRSASPAPHLTLLFTVWQP